MCPMKAAKALFGFVHFANQSTDGHSVSAGAQLISRSRFRPVVVGSKNDETGVGTPEPTPRVEPRAPSIRGDSEHHGIVRPCLVPVEPVGNGSKRDSLPGILDQNDSWGLADIHRAKNEGKC